MNNFSPDQMYYAIQARHEDIRNAESARHFAKLAQSNQRQEHFVIANANNRQTTARLIKQVFVSATQLILK